MTKPKPKASIRKPPEPTTSMADAFVNANAQTFGLSTVPVQPNEALAPRSVEVRRVEQKNVQASERSSAQASKGRAIVTRKAGDMRRMTIYLPPALAKHLELASVEQERDMSAIVAEALTTLFFGQPVDGEDVLRAIQVVARKHRNVIPLSVLRGQFPRAARKTFDEALLELEKAGALDLKIANDPSAVEQNEGIRSERGLLFFVVPR